MSELLESESGSTSVCIQDTWTLVPLSGTLPNGGAAALRSRIDGLTSASVAITLHHDVMNGRTATAIVVSNDLYEELLAVMGDLSASLKQVARARDAGTQDSLAKAADDLEALATLMDAGAAMSEDAHMSVYLVLAGLASLDKLSHSMNGDVGARLCVPVSTLVLSPLCMHDLSTMWRELPDGAVSAVSGCGMRSFVKGAAGTTRNVLRVYPHVSSGALAAYVKPDDVHLMLKDDAGSLIDSDVSVECAIDGCLQLTYAVSFDCVHTILLSVSVCGVTIGPAVSVQSGYDAIHGTNNVTSYDVSVCTKSGMAVSADGTMMVIACADMNQLQVFRFSPSFERVHVIGRWGDGPVEFKYLRRLCFTDTDNLLVCDSGNYRVVHLTVLGAFVSSFPEKQPVAVAAHGDLAVVSSWHGWISVRSLVNGELIRRFGSPGHGPGQIDAYAAGIRFFPNGSCVLVAECNSRLSVFTIEGEFVKHVGSGLLEGGESDVSFGAGGEIVAVDNCSHRICVFSSDGSTLISARKLGGTSAGLLECEFPTAIAVSGPFLYVMCGIGGFVQVFR